MLLQYMVVYLIIAVALTITMVKVYNFFRSPRGKCDGCSGCAIKELKLPKPASGQPVK